MLVILSRGGQLKASTVSTCIYGENTNSSREMNQRRTKQKSRKDLSIGSYYYDFVSSYRIRIEAQSDDGSRLKRLDLNGDNRVIIYIYFTTEKVITGGCVRDTKEVGNLTADKRLIGR